MAVFKASFKSASKSIFKPILTALLLSATVIGCTTPNALTTATTNSLIQHERNKAHLQLKSFTLPSGERLVYADNQNTAGETLLLIHGFGGNMDSFTRIANQFEDYHVIIPDLLGFGQSDKPMDKDYRSQDQAKRLHELMQAQGLTANVHIGGNSMGGAITVAYASTYPNEVASVWLIDSAGFNAVGPAVAFTHSTLEDNPLIIENYEQYDQLTDFVMHKPPYLPTAVKAVLAEKRINNQALEKKVLSQIVTDSVEDRAKAIAENNIPTLVVWGDKDQVIKPETAEYIQTIIPQAKVIMMKDIGHVPMLEAVKQTADDYKDFRRSIQ